MIEKIAKHIADFTPRLKSNVRALYQVSLLNSYNLSLGFSLYRASE